MPSRVVDTAEGVPETKGRELANSEQVLGFNVGLGDFLGRLEDIRGKFVWGFGSGAQICNSDANKRKTQATILI